MLAADGIEPDCTDGQCPVTFDQLTDVELRILTLRGLFNRLGHLGLAPKICEEYAVDLEDLHLIAYVEEEIDSLRPKKGSDRG